jgi:hypothetical protein
MKKWTEQLAKEEEGDKILKQVLDEIGVDFSQNVRRMVLEVTHVFSSLFLVVGHTQWTGRPDANCISSSCCTRGHFRPFTSE